MKRMKLESDENCQKSKLKFKIFPSFLKAQPFSSVITGKLRGIKWQNMVIIVM